MKPRLLTEDEKEFIVKNIHQFSMKDIADMLGRHPSTIRTFIHKKGLKCVKNFGIKSLQNPYFVTEQEFIIWKLIAQGLTNDEIESILSITKATFKTHLVNLYGKLGLYGLYSKSSSIYRVKTLLLYQKAVREGLIEE